MLVLRSVGEMMSNAQRMKLLRQLQHMHAAGRVGRFSFERMGGDQVWLYVECVAEAKSTIHKLMGTSCLGHVATDVVELNADEWFTLLGRVG